MTDRIAALEAEVNKLKATNQRLADLVRYKRQELHLADLISNDEYFEIAMDHSAVARLEGYDVVRARAKPLEAELDSLRASLLAAQVEREVTVKALAETSELIERTLFGLALEKIDATLSAPPPNSPALLKAAEGMAEALEDAQRFLNPNGPFIQCVQFALAAWRTAAGRK